ncbi:MAG: M20 family metallopeptidase [Candidatus Brocadiia bacterium]
MSDARKLRGVTELLSRLIACPSVNPNNRPFSGPPYGEERMARLLSDLLGGWGAEVSVREVLPGRFNFVARFKGKKPHPSLMLEAHSDTVEVADMSIPPFEPRIVGGRMYGRGACDDKGPMAAMLLGLRAVLDEDGGLPADVYFAATCNEERGAAGARGLMAEGLRPDAALVAEPTNLEIVDAHKGVVRWRIQTHGVATHSSAPESGVNAISAMGRVIERIAGPLAGSLAKKRHPRLGSPTVCVGTIRGGTQVNVVPAQCEIEVDRRLLPDETAERATADLVRELEDLKGSSAGFEYSLEEIEQYPPLEEDPKGPIASAVAAACEKALGRATFAAAPWGADSGVFKSAGIPCVLFGPGSIRQAHTRDEFVELEQVAHAIGVYAEVIRRFGRSSGA